MPEDDSSNHLAPLGALRRGRWYSPSNQDNKEKRKKHYQDNKSTNFETMKKHYQEKRADILEKRARGGRRGGHNSQKASDAHRFELGKEVENMTASNFFF